MTSKKSCLASLRGRLQKAVNTPHMVAVVASREGVTKAAVYQWLSGETSPKAETALRLLEWVQAEEVNQQKNSASVAAPAEPKTRRKTNSNEDQPSGRKKK